MILFVFLISVFETTILIRSNYNGLPISIVISYFINIVLFSSLYFLSLIVGVKFIVFNIVVLLGLLLLAILYRKRILPFLGGLKNIKVSKIRLFFILAFIWIFSIKFISASQLWGGWDAWSIWTMHAKFLFYDNFYSKYLTVYAGTPHSDYPLMLPGIIAYFWKCIGEINAFIPFIIAYLNNFFLVLGCGFLIYKKHGNIIGLFTIVILTWTSFIYPYSASQYSDTLLAVFIMLPFLNLANRNKNNSNVITCINGFVVASAGWIKNEGIVFFIVYTLFFLFSQSERGKSKGYYFLGAIFPLLIIVITKSILPSNDLVNIDRSFITLWRDVTDVNRYLLIFKEMVIILIKEPFLVFIISFAVIFNLKYFLSREFFIVSTLMVIYFGVYLITPHDLKWHLSTSLNRLLHQVSPLILISSLYSLKKIPLFTDRCN